MAKVVFAAVLLGWMTVASAQTPGERQRTVGEVQMELAYTESYYKQCRADVAMFAAQRDQALQQNRELATKVQDLEKTKTADKEHPTPEASPKTP